LQREIQELKKSLQSVNDSDDGRGNSNKSALPSKVHYPKEIATAIQNLEEQRDAAVSRALAEEGFLPFDELGTNIYLKSKKLINKLF